MAAKSAESAQTIKNEAKEGLVDSIFLVLARMYEQMGKEDRALSIYNNILKRNPKCVSALIGRGTIMLLRTDDEKASRDFHKAASLAPRSRAALRARALAEILSGSFEAADKDFKKSFEHNDWDSVSVLLAYALANKMNGMAAAKQVLNEALDGKIKAQEWPYGQLQYMRGDIDMSTLMGLAFSKQRQLESRAYAGFIKSLSDNPSEGKADLLFVKDSNSGTPFVRTLALRGLKIIEEGLTERIAAREEKAERTSGMDWMD